MTLGELFCLCTRRMSRKTSSIGALGEEGLPALDVYVSSGEVVRLPII